MTVRSVSLASTVPALHSWHTENAVKTREGTLSQGQAAAKQALAQHQDAAFQKSLSTARGSNLNVVV